MSDKPQLASALGAARALTLRLVQDLSNRELHAQFDPEFSPIAWHLGHVAWQEECWVLRRVAHEPPIDERLDAVYDAFESDKSRRGLVVPSKREILEYAQRVRERTLEVLEHCEFDAQPLLEDGYVFRFLANHERQHAEIAATVRLLGALYLPTAGAEPEAQPVDVSARVALHEVDFVVGSDHDPDGWDNERPAFRTTVPAFELARHPVSSGQWLEFMSAGGYEDDRWWCDAGAIWRAAAGAMAPLHWRRAADGSYVERTLHGERAVSPTRPVAHVSWYEACAFARWAGARLPSELEWERAASADGPSRKRRFPWGDSPDSSRANLELTHGTVTELGLHPSGGAACGAEDLSGQVWEWTSDPFAPYPGFRPGPYAGYSAPWFDGKHRSARGGSYMTSASVARTTFRNWYQPHQRQPVLGCRLAFG